MLTSIPYIRQEFLLAPGVSIQNVYGSLSVDAPSGKMLLPAVSPSVAEAIVMLNDARVAESTLCDRLKLSHDINALSQLYYILQILANNQILYQGVFQEGSPLALLLPISPYYEIKDALISPNANYRLSRFSYVRKGEQGFILESPLAHAQIELCQRRTLEFIYELSCPQNPVELAEKTTNFSVEDSLALLSLLVAGGFASNCDLDGAVQIDNTPVMEQWDFHDLLFHSRSRVGRHNHALGGTFRFLGRIPPRPAVKPQMSSEKVSMPRPDMNHLLKNDVTLTQALEQRVSVREYGNVPITLDELGEFLYRVARVKDSYIYQEIEFTRRPYPNGGASYELELYLIVDRCIGLESGLYHYDPLEHALFRLSKPTINTEHLLLDAWNACARSCRPEVLFTITARFQRVSWKYSSIAYATILKNVGALYQTMYLVATAMNLGPCALGSGNSDIFSRAISEDYFVESSVGEFMLGNRRG